MHGALNKPGKSTKSDSHFHSPHRTNYTHTYLLHIIYIIIINYNTLFVTKVTLTLIFH